MAASAATSAKTDALRPSRGRKYGPRRAGMPASPPPGPPLKDAHQDGFSLVVGVVGKEYRAVGMSLEEGLKAPVAVGPGLGLGGKAGASRGPRGTKGPQLHPQSRTVTGHQGGLGSPLSFATPAVVDVERHHRLGPPDLDQGPEQHPGIPAARVAYTPGEGGRPLRESAPQGLKKDLSG